MKKVNLVLVFLVAFLIIGGNAFSNVEKSVKFQPFNGKNNILIVSTDNPKSHIAKVKFDIDLPTRTPKLIVNVKQANEFKEPLHYNREGDPIGEQLVERDEETSYSVNHPNLFYMVYKKDSENEIGGIFWLEFDKDGKPNAKFCAEVDIDIFPDYQAVHVYDKNSTTRWYEKLGKSALASRIHIRDENGVWKTKELRENNVDWEETESYAYRLRWNEDFKCNDSNVCTARVYFEKAPL